MTKFSKILSVADILKILIGGAITILKLNFSEAEWFIEVIFWFVIFGIIIDLFISIGRKIKKGKSDRELSELNSDLHRSREENFDLQKKIDSQQKKNEKEKRRTEKSVKILNTLLGNSLIQEKDILKHTESEKFFQLFVYSRAYPTIQKEGKTYSLPKRIYPEKLKSLGFSRMGMNSPYFLINKSRLTKDLRDISRLKKFLLEFFSEIRQEECQELLQVFKRNGDSSQVEKHADVEKDEQFGQINFLLTENTISLGNIGFVNGVKIGLGSEEAISREINGQFLNNVDPKRITFNKQEKVKIKSFFEDGTMDLFMEGESVDILEKINENLNSIKTNLSIKHVLDLYRVSSEDLQKEIQQLGASKEDSQRIAKKVIQSAKDIRKSLEELNINL